MCVVICSNGIHYAVVAVVVTVVVLVLVVMLLVGWWWGGGGGGGPRVDGGLHPKTMVGVSAVQRLYHTMGDIADIHDHNNIMFCYDREL